jgi:KDO2-lipid IV(A) lauroyltransferase
MFLVVLRLGAPLPYGLQRLSGRLLGYGLRLIKRRDRRIAATNIAVCFPALNAVERGDLLDRHFNSLGMSIIEMANGWFASRSKLRRLVELRGLEHLAAARESGRGVLVVCAHFTPVETCVGILEGVDGQIACMYRPQRNAMTDVLIRRGRRRFAQRQISRDDVRTLIRSLRDGWVVLYMPDQTYLGNQSELLPFFGEPAVTNVATGKLARISGAAVLPYFFRRLPGSAGYAAEFGPPLEGFPTDDPIEDTRRLVNLLEESIRQAPEQYLWMYKKFKHRPASLPDLYRPPG